MRAANRSASCTEDAGCDASDEAVPDLLEHQVDCGVRRHLAVVPLGDGERDEEERDADAVVEAALDVEPLPDPRRNPLVGDDRLTERRVGAGQHDREHERLDEADPRQHADADEGPGDDRERESDPEQAGWHGEFLAQSGERDARGIREEDQRERRLRQQLDRLAADLEIDEPEHRAGQQPRRREEDRGRDDRVRDPAGDGRVREEEERDRREGPGAHDETLEQGEPRGTPGSVNHPGEAPPLHCLER